jgi:hypothetical protein
MGVDIPFAKSPTGVVVTDELLDLDEISPNILELSKVVGGATEAPKAKASELAKSLPKKAFNDDATLELVEF